MSLYHIISPDVSAGIPDGVHGGVLGDGALHLGVGAVCGGVPHQAAVLRPQAEHHLAAVAEPAPSYLHPGKVAYSVCAL